MDKHIVDKSIRRWQASRRQKAYQNASFGKEKALFKLSVSLHVQLNNVTDIKHTKELCYMWTPFAV